MKLQYPGWSVKRFAMEILFGVPLPFSASKKVPRTATKMSFFLRKFGQIFRWEWVHHSNFSSVLWSCNCKKLSRDVSTYQNSKWPIRFHPFKNQRFHHFHPSLSENATRKITFWFSFLCFISSTESWFGFTESYDSTSSSENASFAWCTCV